MAPHLIFVHVSCEARFQDRAVLTKTLFASLLTVLRGAFLIHVFLLRLPLRPVLFACLRNRQALPVAGSHGLVANFPLTEGPGEAMFNRGSFSGETLCLGREDNVAVVAVVVVGGGGVVDLLVPC